MNDFWKDILIKVLIGIIFVGMGAVVFWIAALILLFFK